MVLSNFVKKWLCQYGLTPLSVYKQRCRPKQATEIFAIRIKNEHEIMAQVRKVPVLFRYH